MSTNSLHLINPESWKFSVVISEINITQNILVKNSTTVSNVATELISRINLKYDFTEFWFWCPCLKIWLLPKSSALSQFNIQPYNQIQFVRRFNVINIQLPDLQVRQLLLDFSKTVWKTNQIICKKFGIRHHEELSLQWRLINKSENDNSIPVPNRRREFLSVSQQNIVPSSVTLRQNSYNHQTNNHKSKVLFKRFFSSSSSSQTDIPLKIHTPTPMGLASPMSFFSIFDNLSCNESDSIYYEGFEHSKLCSSPKITFDEAMRQKDITIFKTYKNRSSLHVNWMISELTLMEQSIGDYNNVLLLLRYKYHNYYYLNEKYDEIRINLIFHQIYWSVISGETDCSADEAYLLGGILYQINTSVKNDTNVQERNIHKNDLDAEIYSMLDILQLELTGRYEDQEKCGYFEVSGQLDIIKHPKHIFTQYQKFAASLKVDGIHLCKRSKFNKSPECFNKIPIKGNEIRLNIKLSNKEIFVLEIIIFKKNFINSKDISKTKDPVNKYELRFVNKSEFLKWATALRLLSKSIDFTILSNFQYEYHVVSNIVEMKRPQQNLEAIKLNKNDENINLTDYIGPKFNKSFKRKEILEKIIYYGRTFNHYNIVQAKIAYIKCWLTLTNAGLRYFQVKVNQKKEIEIIGIGYDRIILADVDLGTIEQSFEMTNVVKLDTNWELLYSILQFQEQTLRIEFSNYSDCQMFHEYFGGYLFIMMRNSERYSDLSENTFRSLTSRKLTK